MSEEVTEITPYEPMPNESGEAWMLFLRYRDAGPARTIRGLCRELLREEFAGWDDDELYPPDRKYKMLDSKRQGMRLRQTNYFWDMRAKAFDGDEERVRVVASRVAAVKAAENQAKVGMLLYTRVHNVVAKLSDDEVKALGPSFWAKFVELGVAVERRARGMDADLPPENTSARPGQAAAVPSLEDIEAQVRDIIKGAKGVKSAAGGLAEAAEDRPGG